MTVKEKTDLPTRRDLMLIDLSYVAFDFFLRLRELDDCEDRKKVMAILTMKAPLNDMTPARAAAEIANLVTSKTQESD